MTFKNFTNYITQMTLKINVTNKYKFLFQNLKFVTKYYLFIKNNFKNYINIKHYMCIYNFLLINLLKLFFI